MLIWMLHCLRQKCVEEKRKEKLKNKKRFSTEYDIFHIWQTIFIETENSKTKLEKNWLFCLQNEGISEMFLSKQLPII